MAAGQSPQVRQPGPVQPCAHTTNAHVGQPLARVVWNAHWSPHMRQPGPVQPWAHTTNAHKAQLRARRAWNMHVAGGGAGAAHCGQGAWPCRQTAGLPPCGAQSGHWGCPWGQCTGRPPRPRRLHCKRDAGRFQQAQGYTRCMASPFPGMDPWLENPARWPDVHLRLIAALGDELMARVRPRYVVRADERVYVDADPETFIAPDLTVTARTSGPVEPRTQPAGSARAPVVIPTVIDPVLRERFLVVRAADTHEVVTVIELLSPTNKRGPGAAGRQAYLAKRREVLASPAHLVEIDLLRGGQRVPMRAPLPTGEYFVIVGRAARRPDCEVFPIGLRDRLPVIPIPLRGDEAAEIDLQALLDGVYSRAGYDLDVDYAQEPVPPLTPDDLRWARERVQAQGRP